MQKKFLSCVESRIQGHGEMYARFHLGTFFRGQGLTFANALRRTLLSEVPRLGVTSVEFEGVVHEFATIPGVQETVLDILLNIKKLVFTPANSEIDLLAEQSFKTKAFLKVQGPAKITASDLKISPNLSCVWPSDPIATLNSNGELILTLELKVIDPTKSFLDKSILSVQGGKEKQIFSLDTTPNPVQKVNYIIHEFDKKTGLEYITLEIWTNGSLTPKQTLIFALKKLTKLFYQFSQVNKNLFEK